MERFALKIDKKFKSNLYQLCRLCGMNNVNKVNIHEDVIMLDEDELPLYRKIYNCIGIQVSNDDKMPNTICALCYDKINDFHEFREMCYATNTQTRKLLGLVEQPKIELKWNSNIFTDPIALDKVDTRFTRKRNHEILLNSSNNKMIKLEPPVLIKMEKDLQIEKKNVKKGPILFNCNICKVNFCKTELLQSHLLETHVPTISKYHCVQCNETINNLLEIKNHNIWHKMTKTKFKCGRCDKLIISINTLNRHVRECSKKEINKNVEILPNVKCETCVNEFPTKNLFYMHNCITMKLRCPKCNCKMSNKLTTLKHIATCSVNLTEKDFEENFVIKNEAIDLPKPQIESQSTAILDNKASMTLFIPNLEQTINNLELSKKNKKNKKNTEDTIRRCDELIKSNLETLVSIKHEPAEDNANVEANQTKQTSTALVLKNTIETVRIKQEKIDESYKESNVNIEIKKENINTQSVNDKIQPVLKLKIKKEHGTLNSSFIENSNCASSINNLEDSSTIQPSKKRKKMQINKTKSIETQVNTAECSTGKVAFILPKPLQIKQEVIENEAHHNDDFHENSEDQNENCSVRTTTTSTDDIQIEKDTGLPMLKISSVLSGVDAVEKVKNLISNGSNNDLENLTLVPQIISVSGGVEFPISSGLELSNMNDDNESAELKNQNKFDCVQIKKEKFDPSYDDYYTDGNHLNSKDHLNSNNLEYNNEQFNMNFDGATRIKQEIELAEEGFCDEQESEEYENEENMNDNDEPPIQREMIQIKLSEINENNLDNCSNNISDNQLKSSFDLEVNSLTENHSNSTTLLNNEIDSMKESNDEIDKIKINAENSIRNEIKENFELKNENCCSKKIIEQNTKINIEKCDKTDKSNTDILNSKSKENHCIAENENDLILQRSQQESETPLILQSPLSLNITDLKNVNEIAENHNNANLEKQLNDEIQEPTTSWKHNDDYVDDADDNLDNNENLLGANSEISNNSNINLKDNNSKSPSSD